MQRVYAFAGQSGGRLRNKSAMIDDDSVADGINAPPARTAGELAGLCAGDGKEGREPGAFLGGI